MRFPAVVIAGHPGPLTKASANSARLVVGPVPSEGWVLVRARDRVEGTDVMLAYRLVWDTSQETISGDVGVFVAKEAVIVQVGEEEPRVTWTKAGVFWEKRAL